MLYIGDTMKIIDRFREYVLEEEFKISVFKNKVHVMNYQNIDHFDSDKIIIRYSEGNLVIKGKNLVVSKLLVDEVLITGDIKGIELG